VVGHSADGTSRLRRRRDHPADVRTKDAVIVEPLDQFDKLDIDVEA
jgi:hypothetical protein